MSTDKPSTALHYSALLTDIKQRIQFAQTRAVLAVNAELIRLYWEICQMLDARQKNEGWGAAVIPRLARDIRNELPEVKGFSERNIKRMLAFYREYRDLQGAGVTFSPHYNGRAFALFGSTPFNSRRRNAMKKLIALAGLSLLLAVSAPSFAGAQQEKMANCNKEAKGKELKGDERKAFMKDCLSQKADGVPADKRSAQQEKMKNCNQEAKDKELKGDVRKKFMSGCLKG